VRLLFVSPSRLLHPLFMKAIQFIINRHRMLQLLYELHLSSFVPCSAIEYRLIAYP
jgi:hypothetical protein